jgi:hypothetical protein
MPAVRYVSLQVNWPSVSFHLAAFRNPTGRRECAFAAAPMLAVNAVEERCRVEL